jgi:hypothetical protein
MAQVIRGEQRSKGPEGPCSGAQRAPQLLANLVSHRDRPPGTRTGTSISDVQVRDDQRLVTRPDSTTCPGAAQSSQHSWLSRKRTAEIVDP